MKYCVMYVKLIQPLNEKYAILNVIKYIIELIIIDFLLLTLNRHANYNRIIKLFKYYKYNL